MPTDFDDFDTGSSDLEQDAADGSAEIPAAATEGPQVEICNAWDSMLRWYDCLAVDNLVASVSA